MKLMMLITADYASIDKATGKLNVLGAFSRIKEFKLMNNNREKAIELAKRSYITITERTETTEDEPIYVAINPGLDGCIAQGDTLHEAQENLAEIRVDYIEHLLENRLPVPDPASIVVTGSHEIISIEIADTEKTQKGRKDFTEIVSV